MKRQTEDGDGDGDYDDDHGDDDDDEDDKDEQQKRQLVISESTLFDTTSTPMFYGLHYMGFQMWCL